jgi:hypothetical protein
MVTREASAEQSAAASSSGRFDFFGVGFTLSSSDREFAETYRFTYRHLEQPCGAPPATLSFVVTPGGDAGAASVQFSGGTRSDLAEIYRGGSNVERFVLEGGADGWTLVRDGFLGGVPAMEVQGNRSRILDRMRWRAYCESVVFHTVVAQRSDRFLLHAGVMAAGDHGVLLCGETGKGKTTLVLNLARRGLSFLSDEIAWIDLATRRVRAFPRALGLRDSTAARGPDGAPVECRVTQSLSGDEKTLVHASDLTGCPVGKACAVRHVVFLEGFAPVTSLEPMSPSDGALQMLRYAHTGAAGRVASLMMAAPALEGASFHRLHAGPPDEAADMVEHLAGRG